MKLSGDKLWRKVAQNYIKTGRFPFPITDTTVKILKEVLTEDQANFVLNFRKPSYNLEEIKAKVDMDEESLKAMLEELSDIGAVTAIPSRSTSIMVYRLPPFFPGLLEFTLMKGTSTEKDKTIAGLWQLFFGEVVDMFQEGYDNIMPLLKQEHDLSIDRIVPVNEIVDLGEENVYAMEDLEKFIQEQETIGVATCYCRHRKDLLGDPCKKTDLRKNCFGFGRTAEFLIDHGFAEPISNEKALEILKKSEDAGLVHKAFHSNLDPNKEVDGMCACCDCCCGTFDNHYAGGLPIMSMTSFIAKVSEESCSACGTCEEMCNAKAIVVKDAVATVIGERCLGCGVCAHLCPDNAITIQKVDSRRIFVPPPKIKN